MIDGVTISPLAPEVDARGRRMQLLGGAEGGAAKFGEAVLATVYPGVITPWHGHRTHGETIVCIDGMAEAVLYDARDAGPTCGRTTEVFLGIWNPVRLQIPPGVCRSLKCISTNEAVLVSFSSEPGPANDPDELSFPLGAPEIRCDWGRQEG